ncbi:MAG TPA: hypothetical protein VI094_21995 [Propionibacteriaceae bacterium]
MSGETTRFQSRYQLLLGRRVVGECAEALSEGIAVASTRYCYGDDYTDQEHELALPGGPEALAFSAAFEARMGSVIRCVPGFNLDGALSTTIGLRRFFCWGFLAALTLRRTASWT